MRLPWIFPSCCALAQRLRDRVICRGKARIRRLDRHPRTGGQRNEADARYHFLLGQALVRNPDYKWQKRAEQSFLRAAELDPWNAEHFVQLGAFYRAHNLLRKAKKNFLRATQVMPSNPEALKALSEMKNIEA